MPLVYPVKIKYKDKLIVGLISPHLRIDFIDQYIDLTKQSSSTTQALTTEHLEIENLQIIMEKYVQQLLNSNYVLRIPEHSKIKIFQPGEQWINIQLNIEAEKSTLEYCCQIAGILLFFSSSALGEFFFVMAARFNKIPYTELILPILTDFGMATVIYVYSGTAANVEIKGKQLDDWWHNRKISPQEIASEVVYPILSSWTLSKLLLTALPLMYTTFRYIGYWQSMMSMRDKVEASNLDDQIISPKFVYNFAIVGTIVGATYAIAQCTSLSLQATNALKTLLDKCYDTYKKKLNYSMRRDYDEISTTDKEIEDGAKFNRIEEVDAGTEINSVSSFNIERQAERDDKTPKTHITFFLTKVVYDNLLINKRDLLYEAKQMGGTKAVQNIINLGEDADIASAIVEAIEQYGIKHVVNILFDYTTKNPTPKNNEILWVKEATEPTFEHIFFLDNDKGRDFIQAIANNFDEQTLLRILELGKDQDIAEQIVYEAEVQGMDRVVYALLGKEFRILGDTDNLENIISQDELNQLQLIPNGRLNGWSNRIYEKLVNYIDNLAKNLDDLLNMGESGNQVAITIAMLEAFLEFAASGQKFTGGIPPYYDPNYDDWSYGGGSSSDGNNHSSAEIFNNQDGFVSLILPSYNGTDYNDTYHQM